ncbi:MAG: hypothetical protein HYR56_18065 [Acidobacteria bacterium]|nr:hypothetical protein [Acidobacteriota bacterium]MBI3422484.1 hypothetical protein [Acidobacteriota bacterium]
MSHHTLQKLVVRMFWDEAFVAAVHAAPEQALQGLELTAAERAQLLAVDRRAWRHDALRRKRTLRTLAEEFKVSTTIILAETRSLAALEQFFSSAFFHQAVQQRGSLALSFSEFLLDGCRNGVWRAPQITDIVRLEAAVAACRRTLAREGAYEPSELPATINDRAHIRLAPGYGVASFQANVIEAIQTVEQYLFELSLMPAMALCDDAPRLPQLPAVEPKRKLYLLFSPGATGITLTHIDKPTWGVLGEAKRPAEIRSLLTRAAMTGVKAPQAQEILAEWLECGGLMLLERG